MQEAAKARLNLDVSKDTYFEIRNELIAEGQLGKGVGFGGSVFRPKGTTIDEEEPKITRKQRSGLARVLFDALPKDGTSISNGTALRNVQEAAKAQLNLDVSKETYFEIRNELIAEGQLGKGVGFGGSVFRLKGRTVATKTARAGVESALYEPLLEYIRQTWLAENDIKNFVLDKTAALGTRKVWRGVDAARPVACCHSHVYLYSWEND